MVKNVQIQTGQILMLMGLVFTLVTSSVSGVWMFTESRNDSLSSIYNQIRQIDSRLSRIEGILSVNTGPLLSDADKQKIINYINNKYHE